MLLLIIDFETTGTNPKYDHILEIGAILYSVDDHCTLVQFSTLVPSSTNPVESINHIKPSATEKVSSTYTQALNLFLEYVKLSDFLVAHNSDFDSQWLEKYIMPTVDKPWLCTARDFKWPKVKQKKVSLKRLAYNYGVVMAQEHRSLSDCQVIASIFDRLKSLDEIIYEAISYRNHRFK